MSLGSFFASLCEERKHKRKEQGCNKDIQLQTMKFASIALSSLFAAGASAFSPTFTAAVGAGRHHRAFVTRSTALKANVLKLSEPTSQILDKTDVFIFDCDGVIWRVRVLFCIVLYSPTHGHVCKHMLQLLPRNGCLVVIWNPYHH